MTAAYDQLLHALADCRRVLLTGPTGPDGDSIGACLALQRVLARHGITADVGGTAAYRYAWMPGASDMIPDGRLRPDAYDAVVVMDGDRHRLDPGADALFAAARVKGLVDHHASTKPDGYDVVWLDNEATSTCEMVYDALVASGEPIDEDLAALLYVGAVFDTGGFRYSNTSPATHRMAAALIELGIDHAGICARVLMERRPSGLALAGDVFSTLEYRLAGQLAIGQVSLADAARVGLVPGDLEGLVDTIVYTIGVEVAALLIERPDGSVKVSLRSRGLVDVAEVAQTLSAAGGGHKKAAGASIPGDLVAARAAVSEVVARVLVAAQAAS